MKEQEAREEEGPVVGEADILEIVVVKVMEQWGGGLQANASTLWQLKKKKKKRR